MTLESILIQQIITRRQQETAERDTSKFRMSDAGKCHLMRYWKRQGKPMTPATDDNGYKTMELGIILHGLIQSLLQDAAEQQQFRLITEGTLEDADRIGHFDMLLQFDHKAMLYEIKTISSKQAWYMTQKGEGAKCQHVHQILTYASFFPKTSPHINIDEIRIAYINRDNLDIVADIEIVQGAIMIGDDWRPLLAAWKKQEEPTPRPESWECNYCPYKKTCDKRVCV